MINFWKEIVEVSSNKIKPLIKGFKKLPLCSGDSYWTACGYEYDCFSEHDQECDYCLCTYPETGGLWNPETGKKENKFFAYFKYGIGRRIK